MIGLKYSFFFIHTIFKHFCRFKFREFTTQFIVPCCGRGALCHPHLLYQHEPSTSGEQKDLRQNLQSLKPMQEVFCGQEGSTLVQTVGLLLSQESSPAPWREECSVLLLIISLSHFLEQESDSIWADSFEEVCGCTGCELRLYLEGGSGL